ncbi:facilitated trehalose transporter Tret1-like isoform X1 [Atheta coriaria]|uniref:facilitated trehalose transporter Tret1-like isoform X1 n=1 Tax=Dalotia coriaria TaxID=877792 RepID=UPI0031F3A2C3
MTIKIPIAHSSRLEDWIKLFNIYFTAFSLNLMSFIAGLTFSWASPSIPYLNGSKDPHVNPLPEKITLAESSWLTAFIFIGAMIGNLITMVIVKKLGRKISLMIMLVPTMLGYLMFALAGDLIAFYFARIFNGLTLGAIMQVVPVYVAEIASKERRGALGCFFAIFLATGQVYVYAVGPSVSFENFQYINLVFPCSAFILIGLFVDESPFHFVDKGNMERAQAVLARLRPGADDKQLKDELQEISQCIAVKQEQLDYKQLFAQGALRKALIIAIALMVSIQVSIINPVVSYMETIFTESDTGISPQMSSVYVALLQLVVMLVIPHIVDLFGRKILLTIGQIFVTVSITALGAYFFLKGNDYDVSALAWLPLASILVFIVAFAVGVGSVTYVVIGEILPDNAKNVMSTISILINNIVAFVILFVFPLLEDGIGSAPTYWIFSGLCALTVLFLIVVLPETKGKSLIEIQELLGE